MNTSGVELPDFGKIQQRFAERLISNSDNAIALADICAGKLSATARLDIYRYNVQSVLGNALSDLYPAVMSVVGDDFFSEAARQFVQATPSTSGDLNDFGESFAAFLANYPHASELAYLSDLAKLEWAWHRAFHAADEAPVDLNALASVAPNALGEVVLGLHPSVSLLRSDYPLFRIWDVNQPGYEGSWDIEWDVAETYVLVFRHGVEVGLHALDAAQHAMLSAVAEGAPFEMVLAATHKCDPAFDLQGFLAHCVQMQIINKFRAPT